MSLERPTRSAPVPFAFGMSGCECAFLLVVIGPFASAGLAIVLSALLHDERTFWSFSGPLIVLSGELLPVLCALITLLLLTGLAALWVQAPPAEQGRELGSLICLSSLPAIALGAGWEELPQAWRQAAEALPLLLPPRWALPGSLWIGASLVLALLRLRTRSRRAALAEESGPEEERT